MTIQHKVIKAFKQRLSGEFIKNVGWLAGAELANRIFRLVLTVTLARLLSSSDYGLLAIIFTAIEFANVFTLRGGIGAKLIQADQEDLEELSHTAYYLSWIIFSSIFVLQCLLAFPLARFYDNNQIILPICVISSSYLVMPLFMVQGALIQRDNRMKIIALANTMGSLLGNTLSLCLALLGMGFWSVVLSFVAAQFAWLTVYRKYHFWRPRHPFTLNRWKEILLFAKNIVGVELLEKLRANLDYLLVGKFWGTEVLGLYYFAFNAGLGISMNIIGIFWYTVLPHLCSVKDNLALLKEKYKAAIKSMSLIVIPLVLLQTTLAPLYVPIVFGQKWSAAIPILMLICLSALPRPYGLAASQLLIAVDKGELDLYWNVIFTFLFSISLVIAVQWGVTAVAACVLVIHFVLIPLFTAWVTQYIFSQSSASS